MAQDKIRHILMVVIVCTYLVVAGAFAIFTPAWQAPDEPAHYNYIRQIAQQGRIPVIEMGDWNQDYLDTLKAQAFPPDRLDDLHTIQYEDHQPPLYYLLLTPVYLLTGGSLTALRLFSVLIGVGIVWCAHLIGLIMFPNRPWVVLGGAAFVAFLPQHVHILASVNNDALGWTIIAVTLLATVAYLKAYPINDRMVQPWHLGLLVGLGFITKTTTYFMAGIVVLALFLHWLTAYMHGISVSSDLTFPEEIHHEVTNPPLLSLFKELALFLLPALLLGGLWWLRNIDVYGFPDFLGLAAHDAVVVGQPRTAERIADLGFFGYLVELIRVTFNSFWGQFGWMALPLPGFLYLLIIAGLAFAIAGIVLDMRVLRPGDEATTPPDQRNAWIILGATVMLSVLAFLYYNTEFQQYQGRYMFPMLIPLGLWLALGLNAWRRLLMDVVAARIPVTWENVLLYTPWMVTLAFFPLAVIDLWLLWRVIVPNL